MTSSARKSAKEFLECVDKFQQTKMSLMAYRKYASCVCWFEAFFKNKDNSELIDLVKDSANPIVDMTKISLVLCGHPCREGMNWFGEANEGLLNYQFFGK